MNLQDFINAVVLGIVEGLTEFLPVSSTGHLILVDQFFGFANKEFSDLFNVVIQSGAILAVVIFFRKRVIPFYPGLLAEERKASWMLWAKAIAGTIPAVVLALLFKKFIFAWLFNPLTVAIALTVWGVGILVVEGLAKSGKLTVRKNSVNEFGWSLVLGIGLIQCLAMVPGTSRSAATILGALILGSSRVAAAEFSFFLAIPALLGAAAYGLYDAMKSGMHIGSTEIAILVTGMVVAFAVALVVVKVFMGFVSRYSFRPFAWYRIVLGVAVIVIFALQGNLFNSAG